MNKRFAALAMAALTAASVIPVSAEEGSNYDPKSICEGVTITIAAPDKEEVIDWNTNATTLAVEEALGVNLEFVTYASSDYYDKLNVMVNGGAELPDIIFDEGSFTGIPVSSYTNWASQGAIIPLNEYYENPDLAYYTNIACEKMGIDIPALAKDGDGNIWGAVDYSKVPSDESPYKLVTNVEWLKKIGYDKLPDTTEEWYEMCKAFEAAGDVNGNGIDDEVCLTGYQGNYNWFKFLMTPYIYAWGTNYLEAQDGELVFAYTTEEWKEGLKYVKRFFDEGLFDVNMLTQNSDAYNAITKSVQVPFLAKVDFEVPLVNEGDDLQYWAARNMYDYVYTLAGPSGERVSVYKPTKAGIGAVITADCENPEAAFLVLDYLCCEELSISNRYGARGVNWDYWDEVSEEKFTESMGGNAVKADYTGRIEEYPEPYYHTYDDSTYWNMGIPQNEGYWMSGPRIADVNLYWGIADLNVSDGEPVTDLLIRYRKMYWSSISENKAFAKDEVVTVLPMTMDESETANEVQLVLDNYVNESIGAFLTGEWDIDAEWDGYLAELEKIGATDLLALYQESYNRTK